MKYTAKQITPKRYPDEKPSTTGFYWIINNNNDCMRFFWEQTLSEYEHMAWDMIVKWFIDVPGAPPELKPVAYLENKPEKGGEYLCHNITYDTQVIATFIDWTWEDMIDWYIPYRLKEENEMDVIWDTDDVFVKAISDEAVTTFAKDWLGLQDKHGPTPAIKNCPHMDKDDGCCTHPLNQTPECHEYICPRIKWDKYTLSEPEIAPCPNPECGENVYPVVTIGDHDGRNTFLRCDNCDYCSPSGANEEEAIRLHNLIAKKSVACMRY